MAIYPMDIKKIVKLFWTLCQFDNFIERYNLSKWPKKKENIWILMPIKETESIFQNLPTKKTTGPNGFFDKSSKHLWKKIITILLNIFQWTEKDGTFPNSFYCTDIRIKELYRLIFLINILKNLKSLANWIF